MEVQINPAGVIIRDPDMESLFAAAGISAAALAPYRGHAYRVLNYCVAQLAPQCQADPILRRTLAFAAACHDLAAFKDGEWDYMSASVEWMAERMMSAGLGAQREQATLMVLNHHLLRSYAGEHRRIVEAFRRADLIDFPGWRRFRVAPEFILATERAWPPGGFRRWLWLKLLREFLRRPWRPAPMVRFRPACGVPAEVKPKTNEESV
jgi:hypothetical protein